MLALGVAGWTLPHARPLLRSQQRGPAALPVCRALSHAPPYVGFPAVYCEASSVPNMFISSRDFVPGGLCCVLVACGALFTPLLWRRPVKPLTGSEFPFAGSGQVTQLCHTQISRLIFFTECGVPPVALLYHASAGFGLAPPFRAFSRCGVPGRLSPSCPAPLPAGIGSSCRDALTLGRRPVWLRTMRHPRALG